jgi:GntR family transcriptional regulator/MocR family aminotransferase
MSVARRLKLLAWAARRKTWIVEDDYESEFRHGVGAVPALQALDAHERVLYVGTFARSLFPGMRLGYVVLPRALREHFLAIKWLADRGSSPTEQCALANLIESGLYESARRRLGRSLSRKRDLLLTALRDSLDPRDADWSGSASGTHLFLRLRRIPARTTGALIRTAARLGVRVYSALPYFLRLPQNAALILGYATVADDGIRTGVERLSRASTEVASRVRG